MNQCEFHPFNNPKQLRRYTEENNIRFQVKALFAGFPLFTCINFLFNAIYQYNHRPLEIIRATKVFKGLLNIETVAEAAFLI